MIEYAFICPNCKRVYGAFQPCWCSPEFQTPENAILQYAPTHDFNAKTPTKTSDLTS